MPLVHYVKDGDGVSIYPEDSSIPDDAEPIMIPDYLWTSLFG